MEKSKRKWYIALIAAILVVACVGAVVLADASRESNAEPPMMGHNDPDSSRTEPNDKEAPVDPSDDEAPVDPSDEETPADQVIDADDETAEESEDQEPAVDNDTQFYRIEFEGSARYMTGCYERYDIRPALYLTGISGHEGEGYWLFSTAIDDAELVSRLETMVRGMVVAEFSQEDHSNALYEYDIYSAVSFRFFTEDGKEIGNVSFWRLRDQEAYPDEELWRAYIDIRDVEPPTEDSDKQEYHFVWLKATEDSIDFDMLEELWNLMHSDEVVEDRYASESLSNGGPISSGILVPMD